MLRPSHPMPRFNFFKPFNLHKTPDSQTQKLESSIDRHPRTPRKHTKGENEKVRRKDTSIPNAWAMDSDIEPVESYKSWNSIPSIYREAADMHELSMAIPHSAPPEDNRDQIRHEYMSGERIGRVHSEQRPIVHAHPYGDRGTRLTWNEWPSESRVKPESLSSSEAGPVTPMYAFTPHQAIRRNVEVTKPIIYEHEVRNDRSNVPDIYYYIIPGGLNVIFWGEDGRELRRFGKFGDSINQPRRVSPTIVQDENGNELYRTGDFGRSANGANEEYNSTQSRFKYVQHGSEKSSQHSGERQRHQSPRKVVYPRSSLPSTAHSAISYASVPREAKNIILIDDQGNQVPLRTGGRSTPFVRKPHCVTTRVENQAQRETDVPPK